MEDGDDDISQTADGRKWTGDQESYESDTIATKGERKDLACEEAYLTTPTSLKEDNSYVDSTQLDDKEDLSDQESENKTFSSDTNPVDNPSGFLDDTCDELPNVEKGKTSPMPMQSELPTASEDNDKHIAQNLSKPYEDESEQLCSGEEGNAFSSLEESENVHSSVGEEEEALEEEEEEEEECQNSKYDDDLISELSENYLQDENLQQSEPSVEEYDDRNFKKSESPNEECSDTNFKKSDSLNEEYDDENLKNTNSPNKADDYDDDDDEDDDDDDDDDDEEEEEDDNDDNNDNDDENISKISESSNECNDRNVKRSYHANEEYDDENLNKYYQQNDECHHENSQTSYHPNEEYNDNLKTSDYPNDDEDYGDEDDEDEINNDDNEHFKISDKENDDESQNQSDCQNEEYEEHNSQHKKSVSEPLNADTQQEIYEECNFQEEADKTILQKKNVKDNSKAEGEKSFSEKCTKNDEFYDEYISPDEKDSILEDDSDTPNQLIEKHDEISSRDEERSMSEFGESSSKQEVTETKGDIMSEMEDVDIQMHLREDYCRTENEQQKQCEEIQRMGERYSKTEVEQNTLGNSAQSNVSDSDADELLESEKIVAETEKCDDVNNREEIVAISSPDCKEKELSSDKTSNEEVLSVDPKTESCVKMDEEEMASEIMESNFDMNEIGSLKRSDADNTMLCEEAPSLLPCEQEHSPTRMDEHENMNDDNSLCGNESKNTEVVDETENIVVNGEVELTNTNLLNEKETSVSAKEKVGLKRKLQNSPTQEISYDISPSESVKGNVHFKGFKKRYIAQVSEVPLKESADVPPLVQEELRIKNKRSAKKLILETPQVLVSHQPLPDGAQSNTPLTEYAQYLGLQPTVKFKCYNCGESGFPSMLKLQEHQNVCLKNVRLHTFSKPPPSPIVEPVPSTNFRITRKVYLCSACGTYYENWNLFLHMREVHKRHICLFCLLMFSQADKLAQHLTTKHGIADILYNTPDQFLNEFKGSFFVMCCTCEQMFSERDDFFEHLCKDTSVLNTDQACSLCGLKGAHFPTCRRAFTDSSSLTSPSQNNSQTAVVNTNIDSPQNSQINMQEKSSTSKYSTQADKLATGRKSFHKLPEQNVRPDKSHNTGDLDDDYDISDAASYCHVNIHEPEKQKGGSPYDKVHKNEMDDNANVSSEKMDGEQNNETLLQATTSFVAEETAKDDIVGNDAKNEIGEFASQNETQRISPRPSSVTEDENRDMDVDQKPETPPPFILNTDDTKQTDVLEETPPLNQSKSPRDGDSESDSSASGADSHESDGSSSSEVSSDENEPEEKEPEKIVKSEDSDVDKSDSDKMSIVVDEARSEDDREKRVNINNDLNNSDMNENETNEVNEHNSENLEESEFKVDRHGNNTDLGEEQQDNIQIAGDDVPLLELTLEESLETLSIQTVVKECVKISCSTCVYCNHAKKIAVNGKQLVLHLLAEHRFEPVVCSDSGELTPIFGFVDNLKSKLSELQDVYFNTDTYDSADKSFTRPYDRTYECFHCHFITTLHKELYVHNRKMHQKTILLCIMCKSNFYSYSELLCHLCPGIYVPDSNILFRCCLCVVDGLPSAFRLMVHLRKRHHACDVCLETTGDQQKLSNHVWKHKLHHLCYRCGIAYRNKPDITKHLFWKHGTESVLCKKCLQKKWPHVYHFCIPPTAFLCEECNASFSRAVALKVHKRLHAGDVSYQCNECEEKFISKKLLRRHKEKHKQVIIKKEDLQNEDKIEDQEIQELEQDDTKSHTIVAENSVDRDVKEEDSECAAEKYTVTADISGCSEAPEISKESNEVNTNKPPEEIKINKKSKVVDVYDLPPLNLSSESDDSDEEQTNKQSVKDTEPEDSPNIVLNENGGELLKLQDGEPPTDEEAQPVQIVDGVWDNFKTYKANLEKREILQAQASGSLAASSSNSLIDNNIENHAIVDVVMADHDYCVLPEKANEEKSSHMNVDSVQVQPSNDTAVIKTETAENLDDKGGGFGADHNYCFNTSPQPEDKKELSAPLQQIPTIPSLQSPPLPLPEPSLPTPPPPPPQPLPSVSLTSSPKKKQKSPKKKQKQSGSSSSSDSSSNSDSSSCTCGTNCSCSSSSSSSSGSSSTSSDSDSSSSEGRRRQAARRDRRRERAKRKLESGSRGGTPPFAMGLPTPATEVGTGIPSTALLATTTQAQIDSSGAGSLQVDDIPAMAAPEPEENEFLIRESDLDTTETETDEDFYDKYPQKQANKLLAEKRNQLLLLAAVAPVNNGTIAQPSPPPPPEVQEPIQKKKGKTKRHKKAQRSEKKVGSKLKLNIPVAYYNNPFAVANTGHPVSPLTNSQNPTSSHVSRHPHDTFSPANPEASSTPTAYHSTGSGSETESKRLSKRKRIPKKFYGDSSDEDAEHTPHQPYKWRKLTPASSTPQIQPIVSSGFGYRGVSVNVPPPEPVLVQPLPQPEKSDDEDGDESDSGHEAKRSSSDSSNSDSDNEQSEADSDVETVTAVTNAVSSVSGNGSQQKNENLYCYCQCPYDEVSEMIACDGKDCSIEWFHFECVGIMVPPKGKWFCPDCRKKTAARSEYLLHA